MKRERWKVILATVGLTMLVVILLVYGGAGNCDPPADDDDSAEAIRAEMDEIDAEFDNADARPNPGVL